MAEKLKGKTLYIVIIAVAVILVFIIGGIIIKKVSANSWKKATSADSIVINEKDSTEVKTEKIQKTGGMKYGKIGQQYGQPLRRLRLRRI